MMEQIEIGSDGTNSDRLSEQGKNALVALVCLCQHGLPGLSEDVVVGELHHLSRHVGVADLALCSGGILNHVVQVADGMLQNRKE